MAESSKEGSKLTDFLSTNVIALTFGKILVTLCGGGALPGQARCKPGSHRIRPIDGEIHYSELIRRRGYLGNRQGFCTRCRPIFDEAQDKMRRQKEMFQKNGDKVERNMRDRDSDAESV